MKDREMPVSFSDRRSQPVLFAASVTWLARAVIGLYEPDYWSQRTPLDYAAIIRTSIALILTALAVWGFYLHYPAPTSRAQKVWRWSVFVICVSAFTVGISNFIEDALRIKGLGYVWVIGILALTTGLLFAGISTFRVQGFSPWVGMLFLIATLGLLFTETNVTICHRRSVLGAQFCKSQTLPAI